MRCTSPVDGRRTRADRAGCSAGHMFFCRFVKIPECGTVLRRTVQCVDQHRAANVRAIATTHQQLLQWRPTTAATGCLYRPQRLQQLDNNNNSIVKNAAVHTMPAARHILSSPRQFARQCDSEAKRGKTMNRTVKRRPGPMPSRGQRPATAVGGGGRDNKAGAVLYSIAQQQQQQQMLQEGVADEWGADGGDDDDDDAGGIGDGEAAPAAFDHAVVLKHVPVLVCAEVICERCIAHGVELEREPLRLAPRCQCGVPWRGANRRRCGVDIGADDVDVVGQQQLPPDGLNPVGCASSVTGSRHRAGCDGAICRLSAPHRPKRRAHRDACTQRVARHAPAELICKDSLNYFHCALATLPRTFGLRGAPDKPFFFPYHYIHARNLDVELPAGTLPPPAAYDPDRMRAEQRERFMEWYAHELRRARTSALFAPPRAAPLLCEIFAHRLPALPRAGGGVCGRHGALPGRNNNCQPGHGCVPPAPPPPQHGGAVGVGVPLSAHACAPTPAFESCTRRGAWMCRARSTCASMLCSAGVWSPFGLLHKCAPDEEIVYIDICLCNPYCMKARPFPIGTPHVWTGEQLWQAGAQVFEASAPPPAGLCPPPALPWRRPEDNPFRGFLFCRVLPPTAEELGDREPLLPYRTQADGTPVFGLLRALLRAAPAANLSSYGAERAWTAAYTHVELNRALSIGYRVLNVHEVWHYESWASPDNDNGLFTEYVNTFLRLKAEASGWPAGCDTEAARAEHIRQFAEQEGIHLRPDNIGHNPGLRQLAKDLLNSLWGKNGGASGARRGGVHQTAHATSTSCSLRPEQEVVSFTHLNDQLDRCVVRSHGRRSTTTWPSHVLRSDGWAADLCYCDTDSVLYVKQRGAEAGVCPVAASSTSFAAGPKNYGFQHVDACTGGDLRAERKVRSFELNYAADQQLQYERMRQLVINHFGGGSINQQQQRGHAADAADESDGQEERTISVPCQRFVRNRQADIFTRRSTRVYRPVYTKGRLIRWGAAECVDEVPPQSIRTRPFGWSCRDGGGASPDSSVMNEEEEEEEPMQMAPSAADQGEEDRWREHVWPNDIGDDEDDDEDDEPGPERKRARVEQCVAPPSPPPSPLREPDAEPEPVAGCSTWDQTTRHTKHICRNNF
ncbi:hypothetical protein niasHT_030400 [Heterodera trifolii]|uniref:DNA-directed DNA polymerase n=1 Tax=Heterodera trifolii TaxID=157864 RepID=A0ABD2KT88_9BILA